MRKTKFAGSARKHRVGQTSARFVMTKYRPERYIDDKTAAPTLSWVGEDDRGRELEVVAVDVDDYRTGADPAGDPCDADTSEEDAMNASKKTAAKKTMASKAATKKATKTTARRATAKRSAKKSSGRYVDLDAHDYRTPDGTRVTEEVAEGIAERALRARRGRPSLSAPGTVSPTVNARVSQSTKAALRARADARGVSESDLVRQAVEEYLEHA